MVVELEICVLKKRNRKKLKMVEDPGNGYIKIARRIFKGKSKTFNSLNIVQRYVALSLISMANHKKEKWWNKKQKKFITIERGSFITSVEKIRKSLRSRSITTKKVRVLLNILQEMQFLAIETTSLYSHITIINYDLYQDGDNYRAKERAKQGQSKGKARAINKNGKNGKNGKKKKREILKRKCALIISYLNEKTGRVGDECFDPTNKSIMGFINARFNEGRTVKDFVDVIDKKVEDWLNDEKMVEFLRPSTLFNQEKFENYLRKKKPDKFDKYLKKE